MTSMEEIYDRAGTEATLSTDDLITKAQDHPQFQNLFKKTWPFYPNLAFKSVEV